MAWTMGRLVPWCLLTLAVLRSADGKGGTSSSSSSGRYSGSSGSSSGVSASRVTASRATYATAGTFAAAAILMSGSRRRYGTFGHQGYTNAGGGSYSEGSCTMLTEDEMNDTCSNLMADEIRCFDCIACEEPQCALAMLACRSASSANAALRTVKELQLGQAITAVSPFGYRC
eukprot:Skav205032  [mRNA]  locus=scaffold2669:60623:64031:- [translate_table: standard]